MRADLVAGPSQTKEVLFREAFGLPDSETPLYTVLANLTLEGKDEAFVRVLLFRQRAPTRAAPARHADLAANRLASCI